MQSIELPILRTTEMLTVRAIAGRQVFTYQDLAEGFQVEPARVRNAFARHSDAWNQGETDVYQFETGAGGRDTRWFTARGAMRFCRYIKSGRSDALYNHLLDLWEKEREASVPAVREPLTEIDKLAATIGQSLVPRIERRLAEVDERQEAIAGRVAQVEERQRVTDPRAIEVRMHFLDEAKTLLVFGTKGKPQAITFAEFWRTLKKLIGINSFTNRAALTVPDMDRCVAYAIEWCETRGVKPPTLFEEAIAS